MYIDLAGAMAGVSEAHVMVPAEGDEQQSPVARVDDPATAADVAAVEPVLRRVVGARVQNRADVDDLVQDALVRLLAVRERLSPEAVLPYAVAMARNLVVSHARVSSRSGLSGWMGEVNRPAEPDEMLLREEEHRAMRAALAQLPEVERDRLLAYEGDERPPADVTTLGEPTSSVRVRLARSRAKLRVEYVLALRKVELPTARCRPVLVALSGGDVARQRAVRAGQHLSVCATCASLSGPLTQRSRGMAVLFPLALARWLARAARTHPAATTAASALAAAAVVAGVTVAGRTPSVKPRPPSPASLSAAPSSASTTPAVASVALPVIDGLEVDGRPVTIGSGGSLSALVGHSVVARDIYVQSVVTHNGFWVGPDQSRRMWVELVGPLRNFAVTAGAHVSFTGQAVAQTPAYPATAGVRGADGALLQAQDAHIQAVTTDLSVAG